MRKKWFIPLCVTGSLLIIIAAVFGISKYRDSQLVIEVTPVEYVSTYYYEETGSVEGMILSNMSQEIYLEENQLVKALYVAEGDEVKIGDKILEYDTTLTEIDQRAKEIEILKLEQQIKDLNKEISNLQSGNFSMLSQQTSINPVLLTAMKPVVSITETFSDVLQDKNNTDIESETEQEAEDLPEIEIKLPEPVDRLDYDATVYDTPEGDFPIVYCHSGTIITQEFLHLIKGLDKEGKPIKEFGKDERGALDFIFIMQLDQDKKTTLVILKDLILPDEGIKECTVEDFIKTYIEPKENNTPDQPGTDGPGGMIGPSYTRGEINQMVMERQLNIAELLTSKKQAELDIQKLEITLNHATVTSTVNGIVKKAGNPEEGTGEGEAFVVVDSKEGLYLSSTINELQLGKIQIGDTVQISSWMTGMTCEATITEISEYPTTNNQGYGPATNLSFYPIKAYVDASAGLTNHEWVQVTLSENTTGSEDALYLNNAYILEENNHSYVYIRDENNHLKKQEVVTGKIVYGSYLEIKSGLLRSDYIAFPYTKGIKEGIRTKEASDEFYY